MIDDNTPPNDEEEVKGKGKVAPVDGFDESDEDIIKMVKDARKESDKHLSEWLKEARDCYDLASGNQWSDEDKAVLEKAGRPAVTFNRIGPVLDSVAGSEISNRQQVQYIPRTPGASGVNDLLTGAAQWVRDNCDAEDEESDAFFDLLVCGLGAIENSLDYTDDAEGQLLYDRVDPLNTRYDPTAKKRNLTDRKWCQRDKWMTSEEIEEKWPDAEIGGKDLAGVHQTDEEGKTPHDATNAWLYKDGAVGYDAKQGKFLVIHHQWFSIENYYKALDPHTGQIVELDEDKHELAKAAMGDSLQSVAMKRKCYKQAFVGGGSVLEKSKLPTQKGGFTLQFMTGKRDRNKNTWYGLVRPMSDPQRWANKFFSQILHIVNSNAKGGLMIEDGAVDNIRKLEENWSKADSVIVFNQGAIAEDRIREKPIPAYPLAPEKLMEFSVSSIRDTTGVNLELMGMADREQAGVLEAHRKQAGMIVLSSFFDSLRRYRKMNGRLVADFIQNYLSDGRLVKIVGQDGTEQYIPLLRQEDVVEYDVVVDESPTSHNVKERVFGFLMQALPSLLKMGMSVPKELVDYLPIPASLAGKWKTEMNQQPPQDPMAGEKLKIQGQQQIEQIKGQVAAQNHQAQVMADAQLAEKQAQLDAQVQAHAQSVQSQQNTVQNQLEAQREQQKAELNARLEQMRIAADERAAILEGRISMLIAHMNNMAKVEVAEVAANTTLQAAQISAANAGTSDNSNS